LAIGLEADAGPQTPSARMPHRMFSMRAASGRFLFITAGMPANGPEYHFFSRHWFNNH
jgi:hypothetical protein